MSDVVDQLKREAKRKRDNMRSNGLGHPYVKFMEDDAIERIAELEAENETLKTESRNRGRALKEIIRLASEYTTGG